MKYILVTGGVISGIGKGVIASSIGTILKAGGIRTTFIKIDPYINIDAGTFSPYEHGEVFVLDDGAEVDLDLGNYERFLDITLHHDNNITAGKVYQQVISKEREGGFLGKTVQVVPHITDAIQEWVERVAKLPVDGQEGEPACCIVELGGTVGEIEGLPFVEAFRQFEFRVGKENFCCVHVSWVPQAGEHQEQKSKPTQTSVRELRSLGLTPDLIMCRSTGQLLDAIKDKISMFCNIPTEHVIGVRNCSTMYRVPLLLEEEKLVEYFAQRLNLPLPSPHPSNLLSEWRQLADRHEEQLDEVNIALVGKYTRLEDAYASVVKALEHAAMKVNRKLNLKYISSTHLEPALQSKEPDNYTAAWEQLTGSQGVIIPGGFDNRGLEGMVLAAHWARTNNKPFLGVCLGLQCAVIEFARNVLGWEDAHSTEANPDTTHPVVKEMPEHQGSQGGTMRLGKRKTVFTKENSIIKTLYGEVDCVEERHRHRYEVNPDVVLQLEEKGLRFVGHDTEGQRMEILELADHPYYIGVQYHPEYISRPLRPSPPYHGLLMAASGQLDQHLTHQT